ncbi:MAG: ribosome-associated translation inhibitor RaiA [Proteobacteria bacterium]|nr:ribosome-associated translation inhibitor RaiA [Pseudomonadota bacterium]
MQTSITFKNLDSSDALKSYIQKKLDRFDKLLDSPAEASVVLSVEKIRHIAEIKLASDRLNIQAKEETENMYSSIDMIIDKLKKQITKSKQKVRERRPGPKSGIKGSAERNQSGLSDDDPEDDSQVIIENIHYKPMDINEAIMQIDIEKENFFVFTHAKTNRVNVLYKRKDGHLGLIQPTP